MVLDQAKQGTEDRQLAFADCRSRFPFLDIAMTETLPDTLNPTTTQIHSNGQLGALRSGRQSEVMGRHQRRFGVGNKAREQLFPNGRGPLVTGKGRGGGSGGVSVMQGTMGQERSEDVRTEKGNIMICFILRNPVALASAFSRLRNTR